jgi:hypothetical protein
LSEWLGVLGFNNFEIPADLSGKELVNLAMPRNRRRLALHSININRVLRALSMKRAAVLLEVSD